MTSLINNMHKPVLINEAINYLPNKENLSVIDATFGGGSYSKIIFESDNVINLIAVDRDPLATKISKKIKQTKNKNFKLCRGNFSEIDYLVKDFMKENKLSGFDAILKGEVDELPENAFAYVGTIDEAIEKHKKSAA